jgi:hypothetical protein
MRNKRRIDDALADLLGEPRPTQRNVQYARRDRPLLCKMLISWIAKGKTVRTFCQQPGTPCMRTIYHWLKRDAVLNEHFQRARAIGFDALAQECLDIADARGDVQHRTLRISTRLKLLALWDPKRYGRRVQLAGDETSPIRLSHDDTMRRILELLAVAKRRQLRDPKNRLRELMN